jgi:DNA-binding transcriptional LysR family regulator
MEMRQLRYFVAVAETLHFGRAAELLHIAQPSVSQQIRQLERELGTALLDRSPRHVQLTPAGEQFLPAARAVLAAEEQARSAVAEFAQPQRQVLRLGLGSGFGDQLDRVLEEFARTAPEVTVDLVAAPVRERLGQVAEGTLDAALVRGKARWPGLRSIVVWPEQTTTATLPACLPGIAQPVIAQPVPGPPVAGQTAAAQVAAQAAAKIDPVTFLPLRTEGLYLPTSVAIREGAVPPLIKKFLAACVVWALTRDK